MKKINIAGMLVFVGAIIFGCSSPAHVEKDSNTDLSNYKTYMWVDIKASEKDASSRATAFADLSVHNSVNAELNKWGWQEVKDNPDILVSYDVLVERNVETQSDPVYSQPYSRYYYNPYTRRWSTIYYPSQFLGYQQYQVPVREATVTITMMDADTDKRIWQGWTTERLSGGLSDLDVKKSVRNIFKESGNAAP
jgi:tRNA U54 and U55 pseudouridine synthase Pus10